ncbi:MULTISPECIES: LexA family transcriptional regulator [Eubacteriales]|mgnify:FL=1|uniref:LexA family protein n=2 Tax=Clostridia TaxID=186801 RepID=UPI000B3822D6|nr:S24 family peptidase [Gemmiger sp. An50]OUN16269.1 transcriptional regulator [Gemmiger sp. An87]OUN88036.1 transcriptional regulator [Gemmiger sp. An50]
MFPQRLKQLRKEMGLSQKSLSEHLGVTQQAVGKWETGRSSPDPATLARLAELLETSADYLLGISEQPAEPAAPSLPYAESPIPVIGTVRAGYGSLAFEEDYGVEYACVKDPANYFYLVVKGDSMEPRIQDGDLALVHRQPTLENGDLGVMVFGEGEGTLKKYIQRGNAVILQPFNPAYEEKVIRGEELNQLFIAGKVVETRAKW